MKNEVNAFMAKSMANLLFVNVFNICVMLYFDTNIIYHLFFAVFLSLLLTLCYYQAWRNKRKGEFRLSVVSEAGTNKVYLGWELWGTAKKHARARSAREEKRHSHNKVYLFEKINRSYSRVDFSRRSELKTTIKEAFGRRH